MKTSCKLEKWLSILRLAFLLLTLTIAHLGFSTANQINASFTGVDSLCSGEETTFINTSVYNSKDSVLFLWEFEGAPSGQSKHGKVRWQRADSGYQVKVTLTAFLQNGETSKFSKLITLLKAPNAAFDVVPEYNRGHIECTALNQNYEVYQWRFGDGGSSTETNPEYTYYSSEYSMFMVCLSVKNEGCWNEACKEVYLQFESVHSLNYKLFEVYPNPVSNTLIVITDSKMENPEISAINAIGQKVLLTFQSSSEAEFTADVTSLEQGVYFITVNADNYTAIQKFIKEN